MQWMMPWLADAMIDWCNGWLMSWLINGRYNGWCNGRCHGWCNGRCNGWGAAPSVTKCLEVQYLLSSWDAPGHCGTLRAVCSVGHSIGCAAMWCEILWWCAVSNSGADRLHVASCVGPQLLRELPLAFPSPLFVPLVMNCSRLLHTRTIDRVTARWKTQSTMKSNTNDKLLYCTRWSLLTQRL